MLYVTAKLDIAGELAGGPLPPTRWPVASAPIRMRSVA
jgi:hypothetical protein